MARGGGVVGRVHSFTREAELWQPLARLSEEVPGHPGFPSCSILKSKGIGRRPDWVQDPRMRLGKTVDPLGWVLAAWGWYVIITG